MLMNIVFENENVEFMEYLFFRLFVKNTSVGCAGQSLYRCSEYWSFTVFKTSKKIKITQKHNITYSDVNCNLLNTLLTTE